MKRIRVGVLGATGYSGAEVVRLLRNHPGVEIAVVTAEQYVGRRLSAVHPYLRGCDWTLQAADPEALIGQVEVAVGALPEDVSATMLPRLVEAGVRVIDLSAAFRIKCDDLHRRWYKVDPAPALRRSAVYGLTEINRHRIREARLVANPGCYPTGMLLATVPLLRAGVVAGPIIVDAKSGVSGARRRAAIEQLFCEVNENVRAYAIGDHRHGPEMEQEVEAALGHPHPVLFAPHVVPMNRGILSTIFAPIHPEVTVEKVADVLDAAYCGEPFVALCDGRWPEVRETRGTNICAIGWGVNQATRTAVLVTAIDNLGKGAAGQAVQNLNLMCGFDETLGLQGAAVVP